MKISYFDNKPFSTRHLFIIFFVSILFGFSSCSKDKPESKPTLYGTWSVTHCLVRYQIEDCWYNGSFHEGENIQFKNDGTIIMRGLPGISYMKGTFTSKYLPDEEYVQLTILVDGKTIIGKAYPPFSVDGKEIEFDFSDMPIPYSIHYYWGDSIDYNIYVMRVGLKRTSYY